MKSHNVTMRYPRWAHHPSRVYTSTNTHKLTRQSVHVYPLGRQSNSHVPGNTNEREDQFTKKKLGHCHW